MNPKRVLRLAVTAILLLSLGGGAAVYLPYHREKAALTEFERLRVSVGRPRIHATSSQGFNLASDGQYGQITVEPGGPTWLLALVGDGRIGPFDRIMSVAIHRRLYIYVDEASTTIPSTYTFDVYWPLSEESIRKIAELLLQLRSIDELTVDDGLLSDTEFFDVYERFPAARIWIRDEAGRTREWSPPSR